MLNSKKKIDVNKIKENEHTAYFGKQIYYYKSIGSTNEIAHEFARKLAPSGALIIAETQKTGRGRRGRIWSSPNGGLWFSLILRPNFPPEEASKITLITALAIVEAIKDLYEINIFIKWPNDLMVNDRKLCGILIEMKSEIDKLIYLIIGVGINVNNSIPSSLDNIAVSLNNVLNKKINRTELLNKILYILEQKIIFFEKNGFNSIIDEIKKICGTINKKVKVVLADQEIFGICKDLDQNGSLILDVDGSLRTITSGDVIHLR